MIIQSCWTLLIMFFFFFKGYGAHRDLRSSPTRRSSDLTRSESRPPGYGGRPAARMLTAMKAATPRGPLPERRAYTGPIEKMMEEISPEAATATTPSGELR